MKTTIRIRSALLGLAALFLVVPACRPHSAVEPVPRADQWWQDRHNAMNKQVAELGEKVQVVFIGDSITQGWEGAGREIWDRYYATRNAVNLGISGDRTQHVLWRLDNGNLEGIQPRAAVVMIGTNNSNGDDHTAGQIADGVAAIVAKLRARLPATKVLLLGIFPRGENFNEQRGKVLQANQVLQKLADGEHVFWVDFGHQFLTPDGLIPRELMPDFLHLSTAGYQIWADAIEPPLAALLGDGAVAAAPAGLAGEWAWTIGGSAGETFEGTMILQSQAGTVSGRFSRGPDRWLEIEEGRARGNEVSWIIRRDRPDGSIMVYRMSGALEGDRIAGEAKTQMNGAEITVPWSARRK